MKMKRNLAVRIMSILLASLVGLGALGSGLYAIFSGSKPAQQDEATPLFMYNDTIYLVTGETLEVLPDKGEMIQAENIIKPNVVPVQNGDANFGSVGDTYILIGEDMYYSFDGAYHVCVPVSTKPVE